MLPCKDSQKPYHSLTTVHKFTILFLRVLPISFPISACQPFHLSACNVFLKWNLVLESYNKMCGRNHKFVRNRTKIKDLPTSWRPTWILHAGHILRTGGEAFTVMKKVPKKIQIIYVVHISAENNAATNVTFFEAIQKVNLPEFVGFRYTILIGVWCITHSALLQMFLNYSDSETDSISPHPPKNHHICINGLLKTFFKIRILLFLRILNVTIFRSESSVILLASLYKHR